MTLDFIDNEKAEQIIKARNDGNIWYGYEEFAQAFSLQPHQYADIEAKISFPLKQTQNSIHNNYVKFNLRY